MNGGRERTRWRPVDGVLLLDKAAGVTSNAALQAARRLYRAAKAGHTGTLDPLATGLLPVLFGEATKFGGELLEADKTYAAAIALGATTTTGDAEGEVVERREVMAARAEVERVLAGLRGEIAQVPPMYSALKRDGRPLYEYARAGHDGRRDRARPIRIDELTLDAFEGTRLSVTSAAARAPTSARWPRTSARALGCGAHLAQLRRLAIGPFSVADALTLDALGALDAGARDARLLRTRCARRASPGDQPRGSRRRTVRAGRRDRVPGRAAGRTRVYGPDGTFLGLGVAGPDGRLRPRRLLRTGDAAASCVAVPKTL